MELDGREVPLGRDSLFSIDRLSAGWTVKSSFPGSLSRATRTLYKRQTVGKSFAFRCSVELGASLRKEEVIVRN